MKKVGLAAFDHVERSAQQYSELSANLLKKQSEELNAQVELFQSTLGYFAVEHAKEIRTNAQFRNEFAKMCTAIGVDPLASSSNKKGSLWASLLGNDVNDFYFQLAVKVIELCRITRDENGGLIAISELRLRLADPKFPGRVDVSESDIEQAVKALKTLGNGFELVNLGTKVMVRSVPSEMNSDLTQVLTECELLGYVTVDTLLQKFEWSSNRSSNVLLDMVREGLLWVDSHGNTTRYWTPSWLDR